MIFALAVFNAMVIFASDLVYHSPSRTGQSVGTVRDSCKAFRNAFIAEDNYVALANTQADRHRRLDRKSLYVSVVSISERPSHRGRVEVE